MRDVNPIAATALGSGNDAPLVKRIRAYVLHHPEVDCITLLLRASEMARAIDDAAEDWTSENMKNMIGATARARRLWCDITGEPLV